MPNLTARQVKDAQAQGVDPDSRQRICVSEPFCKCVGYVNEWDECDCFAGLNDKACVACGADLKLIDINTGENIAELQEV